MAIASVAGLAVGANPSSTLAQPEVVIPAQAGGTVPVVVRCSGVPLHTTITVTANSANGPAVSASGLNSAGTLASSTATIALNLPRGSGLLYAKASVATVGATGANAIPAKAGGAAATRLRDLPLAQTGLTTDGERIAAVEAEATLGGPSRTVYVTESGKRLPAPAAR